MSDKMIALAHPGRYGDAMMAWPLARAVNEQTGRKIAFHTSAYCAKLERLCRYQSWCGDFVIPPEYVEESHGCGIQPWSMPIDASKYEAVYQCGFSKPPYTDRSLYVGIRDNAGRSDLHVEIKYEVPDVACAYPYVVMCSRGFTSYWEVFKEFAQKSPIPVIEIGAKGEYVSDGAATDMTGMDFLETATLLSRARAYIGIFSSQLVLADGFNMTRICCHDGHHWDVPCGTQTPYNLYPVLPSANDLIGMTQFLTPMSRCYHPDDMKYLLAEANNVDEMTGYLNGTFFTYHPGRRWEYGLAMQAMKRINANNVLDVGGASSVLSALAAVEPTAKDKAIRLGADVTVVDPCGLVQFEPWVREQERRIGKSLNLVVRDFMEYQGPEVDAVCCISVLEHVPDDVPFFRKLLTHVRVGGLLVLTVDFLPSGEQRTTGHLRTYNAEKLGMLVGIASMMGFQPFGGEPDWEYLGNHVDSYSFASLVLKRNS